MPTVTEIDPPVSVSAVFVFVLSELPTRRQYKKLPHLEQKPRSQPGVAL